MRTMILAVLLCSVVAGCVDSASKCPLLNQAGVVDPDAALPDVPREFRAVWVATVANIDWPSKPGLTGDEQQAELIAILDQAAAMNLNAVILQVRCTADALYASELEPWSAYLTGPQGTPPEPYYDPLTFAVAEAHARGIELHAWFNPFRAQHPADTSLAPLHVAKKHPEWVRSYGSYLWMDPGEPEARAFSLAVFRDVVRRYDIDGIHVDDYFYPYQVRGDDGEIVEFPDDGPWQRYLDGGGELSRSDWRRDNINRFMQASYTMVREEKPHVKVGISPFGIWRPGHPEQIEGFDAYEGLYADALLWWKEGWLDYLTPQLYWRINPPAQSYPVLMNWWAQQNERGRHLWPGQYASRVGTGKKSWPAEEIANQIHLTRAHTGAGGNVLFSMKPLMRNQGGLTDLLQQVYALPALVPACPWLDDAPPAAPQVSTAAGSGDASLRIRMASADEDAAWWVVQTRYGRRWDLRILPASRTEAEVPVALSDVAAVEIAVRSVDRCGNLSVPVIIR